MLELQNIGYAVEEGNTRKEILKNISLKIDDRFVAITGPNGGGKSTLAKIIAGINKPTSGKILLDGEDITDLSVTERANKGISFAFQQPVRFKGLTVRDLITLAKGEKISVAEACSYLSEVGLCAKDYINREVNASLSGGELKRIEIAMIIARGTKLSLFDEPEAGIDLWSFNNLIKVFEGMHEKINGSILIISHQERILNIADKIIVISDGQVAAQGTKQEVLPKLSYEAENIGIIAPYNAQVDALLQQIGTSVDIATVHKFQGREKDAIVMSTVENQISDFVDDPNLLNVAVSRAKQKFCLVVTGNKQQKSGNISDLLAYIEYNNFTVTESKIRSIFDYLYKQYTEARMAYLATRKRVSKYDSENLTYALIEDILCNNAAMLPPRHRVPSAFADVNSRFFATQRKRVPICRERTYTHRFPDLQQGRQTARAHYRDRRVSASQGRFPAKRARYNERPHIGTLRHPLRATEDHRKQRTRTNRNQN